MFNIYLMLFIAVVVATAAIFIEKDSSIKNFILNAGIGAAGYCWTMFALTVILPQL